MCQRNRVRKSVNLKAGDTPIQEHLMKSRSEDDVARFEGRGSSVISAKE